MKARDRKRILKLRKRKERKDSLRLKFFARPFIILITALAITVIYYIGDEIQQFSLREGDIALRNVFAPFDFTYRAGIDSKRTEEEKENARREAGEVYIFKKNTDTVIIENFKKIFHCISSVSEEQLGGDFTLPENLIPYMPQNLSFNDLYSLKDGNIGETIGKISDILKEFYKNSYLIADSELLRFLSSGAKYLYIKIDNDYVQLHAENFRITPLSRAKETIHLEIRRQLRLRRESVMPDIVSWNLEPNIEFSHDGTKSRQDLAAGNVKNAYVYNDIKKNDLILSSGEHISKDDLAKLKEISKKSGDQKPLATAGIFVFSLLFLSLITVSYKYFNPKFYQNVPQLILVSLVIIFIVGLSKVVVFSPLPSYLIPVAMGPMLIGVLISFPVAVKVSMFVAVLSGAIIGDNIIPVACFLVGGMAGTMAMKDVRSRSQLLKAGIVVSGAQFLSVVGLGLVFGIGGNVLLREGSMAVASGILAAFFTLGLLPILEHSFKIVTNVSLLELSDLNHPLLKELLIKAPGTYHHSLIVSSLAEQAAEAIKANPLLARVGSYFHDIGKLEKPEYFAENASLEKRDRFKHDKLSPSMSSLIITNHVKKGIELAQKYKLPPDILDFIEQHHGTSLVYYFYHKALEIQTQDDVKEDQFKYPGPKPQTKEVAIVSLADAVEAATRSLQDPTSARIKGLVKEIINNKFVMGELDECELTLQDISRIESVFTRLSVSIHHARVEYPNDKKDG